MNADIKITDGGKLFIDGVEIKLAKKNCRCSGHFVNSDESIQISGCDLRINGEYITTITEEEYNNIKNNIK